jgi:methylmalonyl-CoA epimerase
MYESIWYAVVAVNDVAQAKVDYERIFGASAKGEPEVIERLGIKRVVMNIGDGGDFIELAEPYGEHSALRRTLESRGEGLHTVTIAVDDIAQHTADLKARGVRVIEAGTQVFLHPGDTHGVLWQFRQRD